MKELEAIECLENIEADLTGLPKHVTEYDDGFDNYLEDIWNNINTIKQALLKAQEQEKALKIIIDREVNIQAFRKHIDITDNYDDYCYFDIKHAMTISSTPLTEEEFYLLQEKLLKEVLENE